MKVRESRQSWHDDGFMDGPLGFGGWGVAGSERLGVRGHRAED